MATGRWVSNNILLGEDGAYRWVYELELLKNPVIITMFLKIFFYICLGMWLVFHGVPFLFGGGTFTELLDAGKTMILIYAFLVILSLLGYGLYALLMGGKYCVVFSMDETRITHTQLDKQFEKGQALGIITALAGLATGRLATQGIGLHVAAQNEMTTNFANVRSLKVLRSLHTIKLNETLLHNQVYVADEDFDFVLNYLLARIPPSAKVSW